MACLLLLSQGTPMIVAGDEFGRTQKGNNNPYCQDNEISWIDWRLVEKNAELFRFFRLLIEFRKAHSSLCRSNFFEEDSSGSSAICWYDAQLNHPQWSARQHSLAYQLQGEGKESDIYIISNSAKKIQYFQLPKAPEKWFWALSADTAKESPKDIYSIGEEIRLEDQEKYQVMAQSTVLLVSKKLLY